MIVTMAMIDEARAKADAAKARMQVLRGHFAPGADHDLCKLVGACSPDCGKTLSDFWKAEEECARVEWQIEHELLPAWWAQGCRETRERTMPVVECSMYPPGSVRPSE